jgi:hypothetical protein
VNKELLRNKLVSSCRYSVQSVDTRTKMFCMLTTIGSYHCMQAICCLYCICFGNCDTPYGKDFWDGSAYACGLRPCSKLEGIIKVKEDKEV